jgi:hypothetical protein
MIRIAISPETFDAIVATMPLGSVGYENASNENGERLIWLPRAVVDRLRSLRTGRELQRRHSAARDQRRAALRSKPGRSRNVPLTATYSGHAQIPAIIRRLAEGTIWTEAVQKPSEFLQTIAQREILWDFFASKRFGGSKKRTK